MGSTVTVIACGIVMESTSRRPLAAVAGHPLLRPDMCRAILVRSPLSQSSVQESSPEALLNSLSVSNETIGH